MGYTMSFGKDVPTPDFHKSIQTKKDTTAYMKQKENHRRYLYIYNLNKQGVKPSYENICKYNIKFDKETKKWY